MKSVGSGLNVVGAAEALGTEERGDVKSCRFSEAFVPWGDEGVEGTSNGTFVPFRFKLFENI